MNKSFKDSVLREKYEKITKASMLVMRERCMEAGPCNTCMYCYLASDWDAIGEYNQYCKLNPKGSL